MEFHSRRRPWNAAALRLLDDDHTFAAVAVMREEWGPYRPRSAFARTRTPRFRTPSPGHRPYGAGPAP
ncbi:hypothetical protein ACFWTC_33305 [Streptomyces sp. NPDC058619]|uniref:hypothetical protein n=1 Tax=unclassified Streptomyces TaxID=2593676 RepID=UPI0036630193